MSETQFVPLRSTGLGVRTTSNNLGDFERVFFLLGRLALSH